MKTKDVRRRKAAFIHAFLSERKERKRKIRRLTRKQVKAVLAAIQLHADPTFCSDVLSRMQAAFVLLRPPATAACRLVQETRRF